MPPTPLTLKVTIDPAMVARIVAGEVRTRAVPPPAPIARCAHRWVVPSPPAPPRGVCRRCGATATFSNEPPDAYELERVTMHTRKRNEELTPFVPVNNVDEAFEGRSRRADSGRV